MLLRIQGEERKEDLTVESSIHIILMEGKWRSYQFFAVQSVLWCTTSYDNALNDTNHTALNSTLHFMLHCTTLLYTTLHHTAMQFTTLQYITLYNTTSLYAALYYNALYYTIWHYNAVHYTALYYTIWHYTALKYTAVHYTRSHYTTVYYTTLHYVLLDRIGPFENSFGMMSFTVLCWTDTPANSCNGFS